VNANQRRYLMARPKNKKIKIDFKGVEGKRSTLPDDDYLVEVEAVELKEGAKAEYLEITMVVQSGSHKGSKIWDRASLAPNALWRLRSLLEVMGIEVPDGALDIDPDDLIGTSFIAVTSQEGYTNSDGEKKVAVRMVDFYTAGEESVEEEEEEKPAKGKGKKKPEPEPEDEDEDTEEDDDEAPEDDDEESPEEKKKRLRKERRQARKGGSSAADEDDDEPVKPKGKKKPEPEEDEDDEDEKPSPKKKTNKKSKIPSDEVMDADEDGLQELIDLHELDVDLSDFKTLRKKAAAVIDALEEMDLLEE